MAKFVEIPSGYNDFVNLDTVKQIYYNPKASMLYIYFLRDDDRDEHGHKEDRAVFANIEQDEFERIKAVMFGENVKHKYTPSDYNPTWTNPA